MARGLHFRSVLSILLNFPRKINELDRTIKRSRLPHGVEISFHWGDTDLGPETSNIELYVKGFGYLNKIVDFNPPLRKWEASYELHLKDAYGDYPSASKKNVSKEDEVLILEGVIPYLLSKGKDLETALLMINVCEEFLSLMVKKTNEHTRLSQSF